MPPCASRLIEDSQTASKSLAAPSHAQSDFLLSLHFPLLIVLRDALAIMQQTRTRAIQSLKGRHFSTSAQRFAVSPFKRPAQAATANIVKEDVRRPQSTAAAATQTQSRTRPAPAFNREDYSNVQPLKPYRTPEMDHSFVGMTGGEIFHEMMLRQNVKHICTPASPVGRTCRMQSLTMP
jgi:hypothetical protein